MVSSNVANCLQNYKTSSYTVYSSIGLIICPPTSFFKYRCDQKLRYDLKWPIQSTYYFKDTIFTTFSNSRGTGWLLFQPSLHWLSMLTKRCSDEWHQKINENFSLWNFHQVRTQVCSYCVVKWKSIADDMVMYCTIFMYASSCLYLYT